MLLGTYDRKHYLLLICSFLFLGTLPAIAQSEEDEEAIVIGGNVYGGGNQADVGGNTTVTVTAVKEVQNVFGGARMANVGGRSFVNIDGEHATDDIIIPNVFGGNDIAGTIGSSTVPTELTEASANHIDNTWNAYVRTSRSTQTEAPDTEDKWIVIGSLFGGGNGDYTYRTLGTKIGEDENGDILSTTHDILDEKGTVIASSTTGFSRPDLGKTYLEIKGGELAHVYGGGNNATITSNTTININNESNTCQGYVAKQILTGKTMTEVVGDLQQMANLSAFQSDITSFDFNHARVFGGNNKATMAIRPTWNLQKGIVRDLYSGGNKGNMTSPEGLLVEIPETSNIQINNLFGGCRMADVMPSENGIDYVPCSSLPGYAFPKQLSARLLVKGGNINNVYGGNDITGKVYGGNAIGIYHSISGDVYGGGNGNYAYTDNVAYKDHDTYGDFYYAPGSNSIASLNAHRPNAEQVSIRLAGKPGEFTTIHGSVFVGGNCASLATNLSNPMVELKMGSYVIANNVYLGNNGAGMTNESMLKLYARLSEDAPADYSSLSLTDKDIFAQYMNGVAMNLHPSLVFDNTENDDPATYIPNSSYVGSFFCGGNVGSMIIPGLNTYKIDKELNIFTKFVGGCNRAFVPEIWTGPDNTGTQLCASFDGGVLGSKTEQDSYTDESDHIKDRLNIKLENLTITPLRWDDTNTYLIWNTVRWPGSYTAVPGGKTLTKDAVYFTYNESTDEYEQFEAAGTEESNGSNYFTYEFDGTADDFEEVPNTPVHTANRLLGGNVYGGCYESGHVNGNIVIDINEDVLERDEVFGTGFSTVFGRAKSGVDFLDQRDDLNSVALIVFGGGYGVDSEVWGSTTVNHNKGYVFQICGGGEQGVVGKPIGTTDEEDGTLTRDASGNVNSYASNGKLYSYDAAYSSTVNLQGSVTATSNEGAVANLAETEYIYAGGKEGLVCGNTMVNLGNGRLYDAFGGACEADILGHSEAYIGRQPDGSGGYQDGFPWIQDIVYGGNDFTGTIFGKKNYKDRVRVETGEGAFDVLGKVHNPNSKAVPDVLLANAYVEYLQGRVDTIYGGNYGFYDYMDPLLLDEDGTPYDFPHVESTFVNIRPNTENKSDNAIIAVFGGGTGYPNNRDGDQSQNRSYVLVDIPDGIPNFEQTQIFGAGSYNGLGMNSQYQEGTGKTLTLGESPTEITDLDNLSAIIDLVRGKVGAAYGGSFNEGVTRRTMVNVPEGSKIQIGSIFGGAYGNDLLAPCDVYEAHVNYSSPDALLIYNPENELMKGAIYGGNNTCRRTLYGFVDINSNVRQQHPKYGITRANVYGAGCGSMTWSEYTEVNLNNHAEVFEVYGGSQNGVVLNAESTTAFMNSNLYADDLPEYLRTIFEARYPNNKELWTNEIWPACWTIGKGYYYPYNEGGTFDFDTKFNGYATNMATNLSNPMTHTAEMDDRDYTDPRNKSANQYKYNTNVLIHEGAYVANYAYGGGLGDSTPGTGDVYGTTYIALLGGTVKKDIYAAGTSGVVQDNYNADNFIASSNAYIKGGMCRNVYGGGWEGSVGKHTGDLSAPYYDFVNNKSLDVPGETHVVIGDVGDDKTFADGKPAITRNVYGGGEGGSIFGTTHLTINNGMIGYRWKNTATGDEPANYEYVAELDDKKEGDNELDGSGNAFGGGYILNSYVDNTDIKMYGGTLRGSLFGGGEVGPVGRGTMQPVTSTPANAIANGKATIYKAGKTHVEMYNGHVLRNVFGGGRGKDSWGGDGTYSMDADLVATLDKDCKGFVFGQTEVHIHGGEIGTEEGMVLGFGNVFGGGDEGSVYSAYELANGTLCFGKKSGERYVNDDEGYYYKHNGTAFIDNNGTPLGGNAEKVLTEDCKVLVEPWLQVKNSSITYNGKTYAVGDYIPTAYLNTLKAKTGDSWPDDWNYVDVGKNVTIGTETVFQERGINIHNAVFAGGNIALGSTSISANEVTVFGNATASIHDVYNRDFITIGTGNTGGLYGDGNLTLVDGYRELNITNYGTDKYHLVSPLSIEQYRPLPEREKAYYEPKYQCAKSCTDNEQTTYTVDSELPYDELTVLFLDNDGNPLKGDNGEEIMTWDVTTKKWIPNPDYWVEKGVVSTYAGRIMNTIQRADFCGVFGSRMVMKGARDRVPEKADAKLYTINRVREVSLNKMATQAGDTGDDLFHGNYFGIYSNVNFFGSLTSDVDFKDAKRTTNNKEDIYKGSVTIGETTYAYKDATFEQWKQAHKSDRLRNNGYCYNQLALASGVYLELTTEKSTGTTIDKKDWGLITGVVELDLINVQTGVGGGYVYAKNQHGQRKTGPGYTPLTTLNKKAVSKWDWDYETADAQREEWETSGNFIHSSQTIIDDCYNESARYLSTNGVPAHYWFISGQVYVYDQYITAHTGSPNAYSETVELPVTIYAASNGKMTLMDVQPSLYAYYSNATTNTKLGSDAKMVINNVEYHLNDPISYWEWYKLPLAERKLFVEDTYVLKDSCYISGKYYPAGYVMLSQEYETLSGAATYVDLTPKDDIDNEVLAVKKATKDASGNDVVAKDDMGNDIYVAVTDAFHSSNNLSHNAGYILTYSVTNPEIWKPWYSERSGDSRTTKITEAEYKLLDAASTETKKGQDAYYDGPTYTPKNSGLYGQQKYEEMDIIPEKAYTDYQTLKTNYPNDIPTNDKTDPNYDANRVQAVFVPAHVVTKEYFDNSTSIHYYPGAPVNEEISGYTAPAYICTSTIELSPTEFIYVNDLMTEDQKNAYYDRFKSGTAAEKLIAADIKDLIVPAYYCTSAGLYGGDYYEKGKNYRALAVWSSMPEADREQFTFNYDALDLLIDPHYQSPKTGSYSSGKKYQYDGYESYSDANKEKMIYSLSKPIDYTATYKGSDSDIPADGTGKKYFKTSSTEITDGKVHVDDELTRIQYESLPNEQRHYAPITVKAEDVASGSHTVYVAKEGFVHIETPYAAGATIDSEAYSKLNDEEKLKVTALSFTTAGTYFYCREAYTVNEKGEGQAVKAIMDNDDCMNSSGETVAITKDQTITSGEVPVGFIIAKGEAVNETYSYLNLPNKQKNFTIHGKSPMETSTLYVSNESDINDLSTEKIITVIYKYDYEESDVSGLHITPVSERHIVNIHIRFESGMPTIEDIKAPNIVLPGTSVTMRVPGVTPGAYEVLGGGWELFEKDSYAENHTNGMAYKPSIDSLYWYQDGFLLAYYAKTYLGKTYSNAVPVSVANYHDLKKVMNDKQKHLHVDYDRTRLKRDSKIYINDYSSDTKDGLDLFKDFYDLSLQTTADVNIDPKTGLITTVKDGSADSPFKGHALLNTATGKGVKAGENLEFFLRTDINHPDNPALANEWTPIASGDDPCFQGTFHGDGHTIRGLDNSLFGKLCGDVYNLGVTGSFTGAGVAESGSGYVESCWISTSSTDAKTSKPVFGNPNRGIPEKPIQLVNCYYQEEDNAATTPAKNDPSKTVAYTNHAANSTYGTTTRKPAQAFYNGEVAYDLNSFYLNKRYYQGTNLSTGTEYKYLPANADGSLPETMSTGHYPTSGYEAYGDLGYVEERFADGDYRYAGGVIPTEPDVRVRTVKEIQEENEVDKTYYAPIWPDDYIFFGQKLTYGYSMEPHQDLPSAIVKLDDGRLSRTTQGNRVYRAPAYYRSKDMSFAHFNPDAYLAGKSSDGTKVAYPNMTAIDFAGHNGANEVNGTYGLGLTDASGSVPQCFYPPLLDDDGLQSIVNQDETRNLLVYAPAESSESGYTNAQTLSVLTSYFVDPAYTDYYDNTDGYRLVRENTSSIPGHLVQSDLIATNDHRLVDKQDFNAPIAYQFDNNHRMWYQRRPEDQEYVNRTAGWQGISLPFTAELVTTDQKGELTHFYSGSHTSKNSNAKIGHEYWLREFKEIQGDGSSSVATAFFQYPNASGGTKKVTNHFLWDYYYENKSAAADDRQKDANADTYLEYTQKYYKYDRDFPNYPQLQRATPYLLGLPGSTYYEFDLSGEFIAQNTASTITQLGKQTITFASDAGAQIGISDDEMAGQPYTDNNNMKYTFKPSYMNEELENGNYVMNSSGSAYYKLVDAYNTSGKTYTSDEFNEAIAAGKLYTDKEGMTEATTWADESTTYYQRVGETTVNDTHEVTPSQLAFRPYFTAEEVNGVKRQMPGHILFSGAAGIQDELTPSLDGDIVIFARGRTIITTSHKKEAATVRIINVSGLPIASFVLEPGQTVETPIQMPGIYIVNKNKLSIR